MDLQGKKALVTGGAVRLGRAIVLALAQAGADVVIHCRRSFDEAEKLKALLAEQGSEGFVVRADLSSEEACTDLLKKSVGLAGRLDILVNNASTFDMHGLPDITESRLMANFWPNLFAPVLLTRLFAEHTRQGKVVHLLDRRVTGHDTACVPYHLAKKGLAEFTRVAALALAPGIAVNAVAPGAILPPPGEGEDFLATRAGTAPLDRRCTEEDIGAAVVYLLRNDALTGQILFVDGGQHLMGADSHG